MSAAKAIREAACSLVLSNRPTAIIAQRIALDERFLERILQNETFPRRLVENSRLFEALVSALQKGKAKENGTSTSLLALDSSVEAFLSDETATKKMISDPRGITAFLTDSHAVEWMLNDEAFLKVLLTDDRLFDSILSNDKLRTRIVHSKEVLQDAVTDPKFQASLRENPKALDDIVFDGGLLDQESVYKRMNAVVEFERAWEKLCKHARVDGADYPEKLRSARESVKDMTDVPDAIIGLLSEGNTAILANGILEFPDRHSFWILLREILFGEEHYFETKEESPRIVDCGMHFGLSMYYFKSLYPKARITGFEPVTELAQLVRQNIERNNYTDVEVLPFAISDTEEDAVFKISENDSMAGSLTNRRSDRGDAIKEVTVQCRHLSDYLQEPTHFLKIDIEGMEDKVLEEAAPMLKNVEHLFCEYHHLPTQASNRMAKILGILADAGFEAHVGQPASIQQYVTPPPKSFMKKSYSAQIWAKNLNW